MKLGIALLVAGVVVVACALWSAASPARPGSTAPCVDRSRPSSDFSLRPSAELEGATRSVTAPPLDARDALPVAATAPVQRTATRSTGTLHLRVADAASGAPLAGLRFTLFSERGNGTLYRGATDERGRATVERLPEDVVVVQTEARGAHCEAVRAVWLAPGEERSLDVRVGRGGSVSGRVVDELGRPAAGVPVGVERAPAGEEPAPESETVVTGADGRYRFESVVSLPRGIWIIEGREAPERRLPIVVHVDGAAERFERFLDEGEHVVLPDAVLPCTRRITGRVVDDRGEPVVGALVSAQRWTLLSDLHFGRDPGPGPWSDQFALRPCEALTEATGAFAVDVRYRYLFVWTREGACDFHRLEPEVDDLVLVLALGTAVSIELVGTDGSSLRPRPAGPRRALAGLQLLPSETGAPRLHADLADGSTEYAVLSFGRDGLLRGQLHADPEGVRVLQLVAGGYEPIVEELPLGLPNRHLQRAWRAVPLPVLALRLTWRGEPDLSSLGELDVHTCLAPFEAGEERESARSSCCGLGSRATVAWREPSTTVELPVQSRDPYFVRVSGTNASGARFETTFGPFAPADGPADLVIEPDALRPIVEPVGAKEPVAQPVAEDEEHDPGPAYDVEVHVLGIPERHALASFELDVDMLERPHDWHLPLDRTLADRRAGVWHFQLPAGAYVLEGRGRLYRVDEQLFTVEPLAIPQRVDAHARRP